MKIKNYLLLSATILTTSAFAGNFYVGAGAAYINSASTIKLTGRQGGQTGSAIMVDSSATLSPRFFAGYEKDNNNFFWGLEAFGSFSDIKGQKKLDFVSSEGGDNTVLSNPSVKYSRLYLVGARGKLGGYITDNLSVFASLGVINSQFRISYSDHATAPQNYKKNLFGIEPGAGISYKITSKWRLGLDYFYQQYKSFTKTYALTGGAYADVKPKFKFNTFMASISYKIY